MSNQMAKTHEQLVQENYELRNDKILLNKRISQLETYIENVLLKTDKIKIVRIKEPMPQCFRCGYIKKDFEIDYKGENNATN